jgi:hypothetical protein
LNVGRRIFEAMRHDMADWMLASIPARYLPAAAAIASVITFNRLHGMHREDMKSSCREIERGQERTSLRHDTHSAAIIAAASSACRDGGMPSKSARSINWLSNRQRW